ncbi:EAL domain-containing protein [Tumidithrix elongata RA019]|uniref:EAL domain-containing protein n=1 Tax=Tumidithrix elongata BACA0141 TaxID=2716417 RepID=A0AAW9PQX5_9CYAN|nr:EAL domain-containing protein [Tumidithrix elongata RA019]
MKLRFYNLALRLLPGGVAIAIVAILLQLSVFQPLEYLAYNSFTNWRGEKPWDNRIAIIAIDDWSIERLGRFPWSRDRYAQLLQKLTPAKGSVVAIDLLFSETSPLDKKLADAMAGHGRVVLANAGTQEGQFLPPTEVLANAAIATGHIRKHEDIDGVTRKISLQEQGEPSLALSALQAYTLVRASPKSLPDLNRPLWLNWIQRSQQMQQYSFVDVLEGRVPISTFQDRIAIVGVAATGLDPLPTPFDRNPPAHGVHLHAAILQNLLQGNALQVVDPIWSWAILLLGGGLFSLCLPRRNPIQRLIVSIAAILGWAILSFILFANGYWIPTAMPISLFVLTASAIALQEQLRSNRLLREANAHLTRDAFYDRLTNLPNRALFVDRLQHALDLNLRHPYLFAVMFLDLDRFKTVNDSFGHLSGDRLLAAVAYRLNTAMRPEDTLARFGGDEFAILVEGLTDLRDVVVIAERIQEALTKPLLVNEREMIVTASVGIAISSERYLRSEEMLRDADIAMYRAKSLGKSCYQIFDVSMHDRILDRLRMENDLRRAIAQTFSLEDPQAVPELRVVYQPIISLETSKVSGFEALIRWQHPELGPISPADFIPLAEEMGLIVPIGYWVLRQACAQVHAWHERFPSDRNLTLSVNLSPRQFLQADLVEQIVKAIQETQFSVACLHLEITETTIFKNATLGADILANLRKLGIQVYIDDFGTGYSSLGYLHRFPVDGLKIDRSFVQDDDCLKSGIVQTIITLANQLKLSIVAEGVETLPQLESLRVMLHESGQVQGYFFFKPLEATEVETLLGTGLKRQS